MCLNCKDRVCVFASSSLCYLFIIIITSYALDTRLKRYKRTLVLKTILGATAGVEDDVGGGLDDDVPLEGLDDEDLVGEGEEVSPPSLALGSFGGT